jgi:hypothetical protein
VVNRIRRLPVEPASLFEIIKTYPAEQRLLQRRIARASERAADWAAMSPLRQRVILLSLVQRVGLCPDQVIIHLRPQRIVKFLEDRLGVADLDPAGDEPTTVLCHPVQLRRAGQEVRMAIDHTDPFAPPAKPDSRLIKAIVRAHRFNQRLMRGGTARFADLAKSEKLHRSYCSQVLRLAYLAPDITTAILEGRQPPSLTATMLMEHPRLPLSWQEPRTALGFA